MDHQGSKLSREEYAELRDRATQIELNKLTNSKQFAEWSRNKHLAERRKLEYTLGGLGLLITLSCLALPWLWVSTPTAAAVNVTVQYEICTASVRQLTFSPIFDLNVQLETCVFLPTQLHIHPISFKGLSP